MELVHARWSPLKKCVKSTGRDWFIKNLRPQILAYEEKATTTTSSKFKREEDRKLPAKFLWLDWWTADQVRVRGWSDGSTSVVTLVDLLQAAGLLCDDYSWIDETAICSSKKYDATKPLVCVCGPTPYTNLATKWVYSVCVCVCVCVCMCVCVCVCMCWHLTPI